MMASRDVKSPRLIHDDLQTIIVCPNGDVYLLVNETARLLVSSTVLSMASSVFRAMFNPPFLESQYLSTTDPPEIDFPDDSHWDMEFLCLLLHHRPIENFSTKLGNVSEDRLVPLVVLADKYNCKDAIDGFVMQQAGRGLNRLFPRYGVSIISPEWHFKSLLKLTILAYAFQDEDLFYEVTRHLVFDTKMRDSFLEASEEIGAHLVPSEVWLYFAEQRNLVRDEILRLIRDRCALPDELSEPLCNRLLAAITEVEPGHDDSSYSNDSEADVFHAIVTATAVGVSIKGILKGFEAGLQELLTNGMAKIEDSGASFLEGTTYASQWEMYTGLLAFQKECVTGFCLHCVMEKKKPRMMQDMDLGCTKECAEYKATMIISKETKAKRAKA